MARLGAAMAAGRFVAYEPTSLRVIDGRSTRADAGSIRADLKVLRPRFDALITYRADNGTEEIPAIAASLGFHALIIGLWNPFDPLEMDAAIASAAAHPDMVVGFSLGNEMIFARKRSFADFAALVLSLRRRVPRVGISITEPFHMFYDPAATGLLQELDFLLVNVHPVFQPWFRDAPDHNAAQFVVNVVTKLSAGYCGPILVKEVGVPTAPADSGFTPERQASFFRELRLQLPSSRERSFAYFSAFDAPWRAYDELAVPGANPTSVAHTAEAHWGLYDENRRPKPVVADIPPLQVGARGQP